MITIIQNRLQQFRKSLFEKKIDTFMVLVAENRRYLSGFTGEDTQFDESAGALFITETKLCLATDARFELQAKIEAPLYETICYQKGLTRELPQILRTLETKKLGFESVRLSYRQYQQIIQNLKDEHLNVELVESIDIVENIRVKKDETEIDVIKKALMIAESGFKNFIHSIQPEISEKELSWAMEKQMREAGADALSFPTIAAFGPNSALPHAIPGSRKVQIGEPILLDWGAKFNGYCSDISRTLLLGRPDDIFQKVFETVRIAQHKAIEAIRPGIDAKWVDHVARKYIEEAGFKDKFIHGLGHGVGLSVHEAPRLSSLSETKLEAGMVVTVEPGIYLPDWGGVRIENMVVVREDGVEVLNKLSNENIALGA
ncbi:MAG: aminopeptidase P family protein [Desulfobacterales bacterium]|nr:aminopeptidase P family protein [Desulfobacterales bacterium]